MLMITSLPAMVVLPAKVCVVAVVVPRSIKAGNVAVR